MENTAITFAPQRKQSPELVTEILLRISEGATVAALWAEDGAKYPHPSTWCMWLRADPSLSLACAQARQLGADFHAAAAEAIISTEPEVVVTKEGVRRDSAHVTWLKNRTDFHMKRAAQLDQNSYGDKQLHAGHDGGQLKAEVLMKLPQLAEKLREAKRASAAAQTIEHVPRAPEPSTAALLKADTPRASPAHSHAPLLHNDMEQRGARGAEPGDPGMEFV